MEMQLKPALIRAERESRAWTQEQLAALTGLGVRTIQRVEATGIASAETAAALSAVFEIPLTALRADVSVGGRKSAILDALVLVAGVFGAMLFMPAHPVAQVPVLLIVGAYFFGRSRARRGKAAS
jgi:transcriptional regulator with XRE-family HTH domain